MWPGRSRSYCSLSISEMFPHPLLGNSFPKLQLAWTGAFTQAQLRYSSSAQVQSIPYSCMGPGAQQCSCAAVLCPRSWDRPLSLWRQCAETRPLPCNDTLSAKKKVMSAEQHPCNWGRVLFPKFLVGSSARTVTHWSDELSSHVFCCTASLPKVQEAASHC